MNSVKIRIPTKDKNETVWATPQGKHQYRIDNSPFFAYGISWGDIVEALLDDTGFLTFKKVVKKSGNRTIRVADPRKDLSERLISDIQKLGCLIEGANKKYICIDIPPKIDLKKIIGYLTSNKYQWEHVDPTYDEFHKELNK